MLGVPKTWVYEQSRAGRIPVFGLPRTLRISRLGADLRFCSSMAKQKAAGGRSSRPWPPTA
jgi:hypothetical protein